MTVLDHAYWGVAATAFCSIFGLLWHPGYNLMGEPVKVMCRSHLPRLEYYETETSQ